MPTAQPKTGLFQMPATAKTDKRVAMSTAIKRSLLGVSLEYILFAENITESFKKYLTNIVFRSYFALRKDTITEDYGKILLAVLKGKGLDDNKKFREAVRMYFQQIDQRPYRMQCPELVEEFLANWPFLISVNPTNPPLDTSPSPS